VATEGRQLIRTAIQLFPVKRKKLGLINSGSLGVVRWHASGYFPKGSST